MKSRLTKPDAALVLIVSLLLLLVAVLGRSLKGDAALLLLPNLSAVVILVVLLELYRRLVELSVGHHRRRTRYYRQIESLFSLFFTLRPSLPLPSTVGRTALPDLLKKITELIFTEKPSLVVEAGSGVSTLVIAYSLRQLGKGHVVSLEHDPKYAAISQSLIASHGLEALATIVHAPLKGFEIEGQQRLWYDTDCLTLAEPIDLLVIDGPPGNLRYPALPLLYKHLRNTATIILDDGRREDERRVVATWEKEFSLSTEFLDTEKGAYVIHKIDPATSAEQAPPPKLLQDGSGSARRQSFQRPR